MINLFEVVTLSTNQWHLAPIVSLPGEYMRGRIGRWIQADEFERPPIAADTKGYVELTVRLAKDAELRAQIKQEIKTAARKYLFDDQEAANEFIEFILAAIDENRRSGGLLPVDWLPSKKARL